MKKLLLPIVFLLVFIVLAFAQKGDPKATEIWGAEPVKVTPGKADHLPPSDAIILFNGNDLLKWTDEKNENAKWQIKNGVTTVSKKAGGIKTKKAFGSCQLHIEWRSPDKVLDSGQNRGNSGIFFMGIYEVQVLDSYNNKTYNNGQAGSIYKQYIPLVNACRPPGVWQTYDIIFTAPVFENDGKLKSPARVTLLHNGVLIQNNVELKGPTLYIGEPSYKKHSEKEPLFLQDHNCPVSYRNIWIREL